MNGYKYVLIAISVLTTALAAPAFASNYDEEACPDCGFDIYENDRSARLSEVPIRAWTDKNLYDHESEIVVQGVVSHIKEEIPVTVRVISPQGNVVGIEQVHVTDDKTFEAVFSTSGA
ncbi:MAG: PEFG-CTERM sorting domain-containing protein, partial [Candidatus Nitrosotenuis sp.]